MVFALSARAAGTRWAQAADAVAIAGAVVVQAAPFVVLGAVAGGALTWLAQRVDLARWTPRNRYAAATMAVCAGVGVLGCECASVTIGQRLTAGGASRAAALAVMFASPAVNPIVIGATFVALPTQPELALARVAGGALLALVMAVVVDRWWPSAASALHQRSEHRHEHADAIGSQVLTDAVTGLGALTAAAAAVAGVRAVFAATGFQVSATVPVVVVMVFAAVAAYLLAICSSSDAFVLASFPGMPLPAQLTFLLVGPVADLKLSALHARAFGIRFAIRIPLITLCLSVPLAAIGAALISALTGANL